MAVVATGVFAAHQMRLIGVDAGGGIRGRWFSKPTPTVAIGTKHMAVLNNLYEEYRAAKYTH